MPRRVRLRGAGLRQAQPRLMLEGHVVRGICTRNRFQPAAAFCGHAVYPAGAGHDGPFASGISVSLSGRGGAPFGGPGRHPRGNGVAPGSAKAPHRKIWPLFPALHQRGALHCRCRGRRFLNFSRSVCSRCVRSRDLTECCLTLPSQLLPVPPIPPQRHAEWTDQDHHDLP